MPDERLVGDVGGAAAHLRSLASSNGKVATIGYCSGGRQSFLAACSLDLDAAVDCYGAFIIGPAARGHARSRWSPIVHLAQDLSCPLLGLFGAEDQYPSPAEVAELEKALTDAGKEFEFHTYEGAGHAFFATDRPSYRPEAANDGWQKIWEFFGRYLSNRLIGEIAMCTYQTTTLAVAGSGKGAEGWFPVSDATVYFDHPVHAPADHTLNIDLLNPAAGSGARVALELDPGSARALAEAILETLANVPSALQGPVPGKG